MATYRTAIIACGTIARVHARAWQGVVGQPVSIGACADTHPDARREFGDFFGVPEDKRYADFREMLDAEHPDFVDVCSWHQQHAEMVIAAAARRPRAIVCQKPMAVDLGEADAMLTACERNGVKLVIAFQRPHHATWLKARELLRAGVIGKVLQIQCDDGGNILNTNSHNIRLALFLMGEPTVEWVTGAVERTTDQAERGVFLPDDMQLGVVASPRWIPSGTPGRDDVAEDVRVGIENTHTRHLADGQTLLASGLPQEVLRREGRRLVMALVVEDRGLHQQTDDTATGQSPARLAHGPRDRGRARRGVRARPELSLLMLPCRQTSAPTVGSEPGPGGRLRRRPRRQGLPPRRMIARSAGRRLRRTRSRCSRSGRP